MLQFLQQRHSNCESTQRHFKSKDWLVLGCNQFYVCVLLSQLLEGVKVFVAQTVLLELRFEQTTWQILSINFKLILTERG